MDGWWVFGQRVVEELDSEEEDGDYSHGVGLASNALGHRFVSDPLRFTGVDLGDRDGNTRSRRAHGHQEGEDSDETSDDSEQDSDDSEQDSDDDDVRAPPLNPEEEALADAAAARIRRAQAKGKTDVRLSKEELAAYQRRLQRMQDEERRQRREQRVAIPISQLDPSARRKRQSLEGDSVQRQPSPELGEERRAGYPPMGYFPPPSSSRRRPRSGTLSSRPPSRAATDREQGSSPFTYTYLHRLDQAGVRHVSDPATGRAFSHSPQSLGDSVPSRNGALSSSTLAQSQGLTDPFQYMTGGSRTSPHAGAGSLRNSISEVADIYAIYGAGVSSSGASRRQSGGEPRDAESSSEEDDSIEDKDTQGKVVASSRSGSRSRPRDSVEGRREAAPEARVSRDRTPPPATKKTSVVQSPVRRKAVAGGGKSGRRKGK